MYDAGLTHGGFYAHFPSREALLGEAIAQLATESEPAKRLSRQPAAPALALADFLEHYLSIAHCERRPGACPLPILLPEADALPPEARAREDLRAAYGDLRPPPAKGDAAPNPYPPPPEGQSPPGSNAIDDRLGGAAR